ncbi:RNA polymerase sigma factor [Arenimonas fontis]|uniref:RNA polymerase sigma factor n=1 Tax=Arenimonas fontis TaxID=2608255 RepID=UPI001FE710B9|nr:DUF6596 domain-containing protein [Arenimonas fontis]
MDAVATRESIAAVFRIERTRLLASLVRMLGDIDRAEELVQDAFVAALADWPRGGIPDKPGAWLMATAKRRAIDAFRRDRVQAEKHAGLVHDAMLQPPPGLEALEAAMDDDIGDQRLGLIFAACHPLLPVDARIALTLRLLGGLTTDDIARAFLSREATIAQRIVRAKRSLAKAGLPFEVPRGRERDERLASVLEVVYLIFNEGYAATAGEDPIRPALCEEALRLGRSLAGLAPEEPEVLGLLALMELQASRLQARVGTDGQLLTLPQQDRRRWDRLLIRRGLDALARAEALGGAEGPYVLQAALAACHARASHYEATDWPRIAALYDRLRIVVPSPVVELNRAIAHSMAFGAETGLGMLALLTKVPALQGYAPLPAARADCLYRLGRLAEARAAFEQAAALTRNSAERAFLLRRALACAPSPLDEGRSSD